MDDFFGREWVAAFVGAAAAASLAATKRIDRKKFAELRARLRTLYVTVFHQHDPGFQFGDDRGDSAIVPIEDRFVEPDVEETMHTAGGSDPEAIIRERVASGTSVTDNDVMQLRQSPGERSYVHRVNVSEWVSNNAFSVILGGPGSGKSTLLRFLALDLLSENPRFAAVTQRWGDRLPIWVPFSIWTSLLNESATASAGIRDAIYHWLQRWDEGKLLELIDAALEDKRVVLLADGVDEWASEMAAQQALQRLKVFAEKKDIPTVISSRPYGFQLLGHTASGWKRGAIAKLSIPQQHQLSHIWMRRHPSIRAASAGYTIDQAEERAAALSKNFFDEIGYSGDLRDLTATPLTLSLLVYLWIRDCVLPQNRFKAYAKLVDHMVETHPARRLTAAQTTVKPQTIPHDSIKGALAQLAMTLQVRYPTGNIRTPEAARAMEEYLKDEQYGQGLSSDEAQKQARAILQYASDSSGILVRSSQKDIAFLHRVFQEYLAAACIAAKPFDEQRDIVAQRCKDPQWKEVVLSVISQTARTNEVRLIVDSIQSARASATDFVTIDPLLAEVAFGPFACSPMLARRLAAEAFCGIETGHWPPYRHRLIEIVARGTRHSSLLDDVTKQFSRWLPDRVPWRRGAYEAMASWPSDDAAVQCLWLGIHNCEDLASVRAAMRSYVTLATATRDSSNLARAVQLARSYPTPYIRAAALEALCESPEFEARTIDGEIVYARSSNEPSLVMAAIKSRIRIGLHTEEDLDLLFAHASSSLRWPKFMADAEVADLFRRGWAQSPKLKGYCIDGWSGRRDRPSSRELLILTMIKCFPQDDDVAAILADEIEQEHPFLGVFEQLQLWNNLVGCFRDHPKVVAAVDRWLPRAVHQEPYMSRAALIGRTEVARKLLVDLVCNSRFVHWTANALFDGWSNDGDVKCLLRNLALGPADKASTLGPLLRKLFDVEDGRRRLLELLADEGCGRPDFVLDEAADLCESQYHRHIAVTEALKQRSRCHEFTRDNLTRTLIDRFGDDSRVRALAVGQLDTIGPYMAMIGVVARSYHNDAQIRNLVVERLGTLSSGARERLTAYMGYLGGGDPVAKKILAAYAHESNATVRTQCAMSYGANSDATIEEVNALVGDLRSHMSEQKRDAAFGALVVMDRVGVFRDLREPNWSSEALGDSEEPLSLGLTGSLRPNLPLYKAVVSRWESIEQALGPRFWVRLCSNHESELLNFIELMAPYVDGKTPAAAAILKWLAECDELDLGANAILCLERLRAPRELILKSCMHTMGLCGTSRRLNLSVDAPIIAAEVLGREFGGDTSVLEELEERVGDVQDPNPVAVIALCCGWRESAWLEQLFRFGKSTPNGLRLPYIPYFHVVCTKSAAEVVERQLCSLLARHGEMADWVWRGIARALIGRIQRDEAVENAVVGRLLATPTPSEVASLTGLVAKSRGMSDQFRKWCWDELERQLSPNNIPTGGIDILSGSWRPVSHVLLDLLYPDGP